MKESFILYTEYAKHLGLLDMEQRGVLFTAIMCYQTDEELPEMDGITSMAFSFIKEKLDRDTEKYTETLKKRSEAGKQGGRPKANESDEKQTKAKKANGFSEKQTKAKKADNDHEHEYVHDSDLSSVWPTEPRAYACEGTGGSDENAEEFLAFMREHPNVRNDITNPSLVASVDFKFLSKKISESRFLQTRYSLGWLIGNYRKIVSDAYKDLRGQSPPQGDQQIDFLRKLYEEFSEEDERNAEEDGSPAHS